MNPGKPKMVSKAPVSLGGIVKEDLPLPYVHYPRHYGTFFAFSETQSSPALLCECSLPAITNYVQLRAMVCKESSTPDNYTREHLDRHHLPLAVAAVTLSEDIAQIAGLRFRRAICHRCNLVPPSMRYCHEMYGPVFIQHFGWYVDQTFLRFGILPGATAYVPSTTPQEYATDMRAIEEARASLQQAWQWFRDGDKETMRRILHPEGSPLQKKVDYEEIVRRQDILREATKRARRAERVLSTKIENTVREEFGFRKVGDRWTSETLLFQIVSNLFPDQQVLRHHRPNWLGGLELDIYIPSLQLAIEYQGQQHFHAIPAWGGQDALMKLQDRDKRKAALCKASQVKLSTIDYTEPLTSAHIRNRVSVEAL